jgi:uncharacterized protein (DUF2141 family)
MRQFNIHSSVRAAAVVVGALMLFAAQSARAADVEVDVAGVDQARGHVRVAICTESTFLKTSCPYMGSAQAKAGLTVVKIDNVPPGVYAAQVFHDDTDGGVIHQDSLGIPKEAVGFSNDAPLRLSGPRFSDASFSVKDGVAHIGLKLRKLFAGK